LKKGTKKYGRFIQGTDCKSAPAGVVMIHNNIHSHPERWMYGQTEMESMGRDIAIVGGENPPQFGFYVFIGRTGNIWQITRDSNGQVIATNKYDMTSEQLHRELTTRR